MRVAGGKQSGDGIVVYTFCNGVSVPDDLDKVNLVTSSFPLPRSVTDLYRVLIEPMSSSLARAPQRATHEHVTNKKKLSATSSTQKRGECPAVGEGEDQQAINRC